MTPKEYYQQQIAQGIIQPDDAQRPIIEKLNTIFLALEARNQKSWKLFFLKKKPIKGLYLWGSVGIGKTFLMDCFYQCLTVPKMRLHFHAFMLRIHNELNEIQGKKNPLFIIAKKIAKKVDVICFDEFFVSNIADAMILGELFLHLFQNGVTLITSSNIPPDLLYKEGLQRERFLPAIELIKQNTDIVHCPSKMDYRLRHIREIGVYYTPLDQKAAIEMENAFVHFSNGALPQFNPILICHRPIPIIKEAASVVWFDFEIICGRPRSASDYLEITQSYHTILTQNLRAIKPNENDLILSFIYFVDILYDAHCRLIISSSVNPDDIFLTDKIKYPTERTISRIKEMQSDQYVHRDRIGEELTQL